MRALAELIVRYRRGRVIVADVLGLSAESVDEIVLVIADAQAQLMPEQHAARGVSHAG